MHIILHQPEIPANTGNIGRTCVATGTDLHLIEPLGFQLNEKSIKRAGMDYWEHLNVTRYINFEDFKSRHPGARIWMATTKAQHVYTDVSFEPDDYIMFGKESAGIPEEILIEYSDTCIRIPMLPTILKLIEFGIDRFIRSTPSAEFRKHAAYRRAPSSSLAGFHYENRINARI